MKTSRFNPVTAHGNMSLAQRKEYADAIAASIAKYKEHIARIEAMPQIHGLTWTGGQVRYWTGLIAQLQTEYERYADYPSKHIGATG